MVNPLSPHGVHKHHAASAATEYIRIYVTLSFYTNISGYYLDKSTHPLDDEPTSLKQTTNKNLIWQSLSLNKDDLHLDIVHTHIMRSIRYKEASKCLLEKNWKLTEGSKVYQQIHHASNLNWSAEIDNNAKATACKHSHDKTSHILSKPALSIDFSQEVDSTEIEWNLLLYVY